jgi:hypothetical protein
VIRRLGRIRSGDHLAGAQAIGEALGDEREVESYVRAPRRERVAGDVRMQHAEAVQVPAVEDRLDRPPSDLAAAQPHERAQPARQLPNVEDLSGRQRIEIPHQQVGPVLVAGDARQQRAQLVLSSLFRPGRVHRAQVDAEHPRVGFERHDLEKRVPRQAGLVPLMVGNGPPAEKSERRAGPRAPLRHAGLLRERLHRGGPRRLLQDHEVRLASADHGRQAFFAPRAAPADVVAQDAELHAPSFLSIRTR